MGRKLLAILICTCLTLGMLTGCGEDNTGSADNSSASDAGSDSQSSTPDSSQESDTDNAQANADAEPVSLHLVLYGEATTRTTEFFANEFHEKVLNDLNIDMTVEQMAWGTNDQMATRLASGEKIGFMNMATENDWAYKGLIAPIDRDLLEELAPKYLESRGQYGFDCVTINGEIVTLPLKSMPNSYAQQGFRVRNDILNQVDWDVSKIKTYDDLMTAIAAVKEKFPDLYVISYADSLFYTMFDAEYAPEGAIFNQLQNPLNSNGGLVVIDEGQPDSDEIINWVETDYFAQICKMEEEWCRLGYLERDASFRERAATAWDSGNSLLNFGAQTCIYDHKLGNVEGADVRYLNLSNHPTVLKLDYDWGIAVSSADADNVGNWLRFVNWMYSTKENYMFCRHGVEGTDWEYNEDGSVNKIMRDSLIHDWMTATAMYEELPEGTYDPAEVEAYWHSDDNCINSKAMGFSFDPTPVETEAALLQAICTEKLEPLTFGRGNFDEDFPPVLEELKAAGLDKYLEEYQRQFSEFMANKKN